MDAPRYRPMNDADRKTIKTLLDEVGPANLLRFLGNWMTFAYPDSQQGKSYGASFLADAAVLSKPPLGGFRR